MTQWVARGVVVAVLMLPSVAVSMEHYSRPLQDQNGNAISGATVTVYTAGTTTLASIFSDNGVTSRANPFTTAITGLVDFYAANGVYDLKIVSSRNIFSEEATRRMALFDATDGGAGGGVTIETGTTLPATCTPGTANALFLDTDDENLYFCKAANVFEQVNPGEADTLQTVVSRGGSVTTAVSFATSVKFLDGNGDGWAFYTDPTDGPKMVCVDNNVENACASYTRKLATNQTLVYKNSAGTSIYTLTENTGALTNITLNGESTGNVVTLTDEQHWPVSTCQNATAQAVFDLPATNAPAPVCDTGTNTQKAYLAFDATTDESFQDHWILPTGFTGAIDVHFRWKASSTTNEVGWCAQIIRVADGATSDPAYPAQSSANCVSDTAKGTTLQENTATVTGVTCTSCAAGDHVYVRGSRDADQTAGAGTDDMTGDALLLSYGRTWRVAH